MHAQRFERLFQAMEETGSGLHLDSVALNSGLTMTYLAEMVFTVEPDIYLTGRGGVRIEDHVIITESGAETHSDFPHELLTLE
jgi:Xaa-Pro aminopeptidase